MRVFRGALAPRSGACRDGARAFGAERLMTFLGRARANHKINSVKVGAGDKNRKTAKPVKA